MVHPVRAMVAAVDHALKDVADVQPTFMSTEDKAAALRDLVRLESRLAEVRLRVLAAAGDVAADTGARDQAAWLAQATRGRPEDARADLRLARALDGRALLARAVREGEVTLVQARVIDRALAHLPDEVPAGTIADAEAALVAHAATFGPRELARLGRRVLDVVAPEVADAAEARRLAELERHAAERTRLTLRRLGDGTTRLSARLPDAVAARLATTLHAYTSPRRTPVADPSVSVQAHPRRLGEAFCSLLEHLDPGRLPLHGGDATTVVVTLGLDSLRRDLATADVLDDAGDLRLSADQARRLACTARLVPAVLGGQGQPPRPGSRPPALQPRPAQGAAAARPGVSRGGLRRPRCVDRGPPPARLERWRTHRPGQRGAALSPAPPSRARPPLRPGPAAHRGSPVPPPQIVGGHGGGRPRVEP